MVDYYINYFIKMVYLNNIFSHTKNVITLCILERFWVGFQVLLQ